MRYTDLYIDGQWRPGADGMIGLNRGLVSGPAAPFGGVRQSGPGREGGHEGMCGFMEARYIPASW